MFGKKKDKEKRPEQEVSRDVLTITPEKSFAARVLSRFATIFFYVALGILIYTSAVIYTNRETPQDAYIFNLRLARVMSDSMEPTIRQGALMVVKKASYDNVNVNDIIVYEIENTLVIHRIVEKNEDGFRTKGDNVSTQDTYLVKPGNVKAKSLMILNWSPEIIDAILAEGGVVKYILIPAGGIILLYILASIGIGISAKKKREKAEAELEERMKQAESLPDTNAAFAQNQEVSQDAGKDFSFDLGESDFSFDFSGEVSDEEKTISW